MTRTLIAANISVAIWMNFQDSPWVSAENLLEHGAAFGPYYDDGEWFRLVTSMFQHGGILHLGVNLLALYSLGQFVEGVFGRVRYTGLYFVSGLAGAVASACASPHVVGVGASGALFGLLGCLYGIGWRGRKDPDSEARSALRSIRRRAAFFIVLNLVLGFSIPGIDNAAHLGGLVVGIVYGACQLRGGTKRDQIRRSLAPLFSCVVAGFAAIALLFPWGISDVYRRLESMADVEAELNAELRDTMDRDLKFDRRRVRGIAKDYAELTVELEGELESAAFPLRRMLRRASTFTSTRSAYHEALAAGNVLVEEDRVRFREALSKNIDALRDLGALGPIEVVGEQYRILAGADRDE